MKKVIKGFVTYQKTKYQRTPEINFFTFDPTESSHMDGYVVVKQQEITIEVPDDFDPRPLQVQALEKERQKLRADFAARCTEIERQISELTCLESS